MGKIKIVNRSKWPTEALEILTKWICKREGVTWDYHITFRRTDSQHWSGRGWPHKCTINLARRYKGSWPNYKIDEHRFKNDWEFVCRSRFELLVFLMGHEICHANRGQRKNFRNANRRVDRVDMELLCNRVGAETVEAIREQWPVFRAQLMEVLRAKRAKKTPQFKLDQKLEQKRALLAKWERSVRLAQNRVKKYRTTVKRLERRADQIGANKRA